MYVRDIPGLHTVGADDTGLGSQFSLVFCAHGMGFMYQFGYAI